MTPPQEEPQSGPPGGVPEESVVPGDDSFMHVSAPKDLPAGQDVAVEDSDSQDADTVQSSVKSMCLCLVFNKKSFLKK